MLGNSENAGEDKCNMVRKITNVITECSNIIDRLTPKYDCPSVY